MPAMIHIADMISNTARKITAYIEANKQKIEEFGRGIERLVARVIEAAPHILDFVKDILKIAPAAIAAGIAIKGAFTLKNTLMGIGQFRSAMAGLLLQQTQMQSITMATKWALESQAKSAGSAAVKYMTLAGSITMAKLAMVGLAAAAVAGLLLVAYNVGKHQADEKKNKKVLEYGISDEEYDSAERAASTSAKSYKNDLLKQGDNEWDSKVNSFYNRQLETNLQTAKYLKQNKDLVTRTAEVDAVRKEKEEKDKLMKEFYDSINVKFDENISATKSLKDPTLNPAAMGLTDIWEIMRRGNGGLSFA